MLLKEPLKEVNTSFRGGDLQDSPAKVDFRVVRTREELEKAYALVYREYTKKGYIKETNSNLRCNTYNAFPQTTTFVATTGKEVIASDTVIPDSPLGLPMDEMYHQELNRLREGNKKLCELTMLACNTGFFNNRVSKALRTKKLFLIFSLFKLIFDYIREFLKFDFVCLTIIPKHKRAYDFLLCKDLGGLKNHSKVNDTPAIAMYVDLKPLEEEFKKQGKMALYKKFYDKKTDPEKFSNKFIFTPQDLKYFFVEKTDVFKNASSSQKAYLKRCYPDYDFSVVS